MSKRKHTWASYKTSIILIACCAAGAGIGLLLGAHQDETSAAVTLEILTSIGQIFLNLLFCLLVPLIFFSISASIASNNDPKKVGKMIVWTLCIFIATALLAGSIMLVVTRFTGVPSSLSASGSGSASESLSASEQIVGTLTVGDFPDLISRYHVLPLIIMTIFFGICVSLTGESGKLVVQFLNSMSSIMYKMVSILMKAAPIGLGCYFADLTASYGIDLLKTYGQAMLVFYTVVIVYFFIFLGFYAWLAAGVWGVKNFFKVIMEPALTALGTRSSAAAIPMQMEACDKLGVPREISSVVVPMGATCHMDGACIAIVYAEVLATTMFGRPLVGFSDCLLALLAGTAASVATSSVPGGGAAGETMILSVFHLPQEAFPILLMVIELFDPGCTLLNSCGDTVASMLVTRVLYGKKWYLRKQKDTAIDIIDNGIYETAGNQ